MMIKTMSACTVLAMTLTGCVSVELPNVVSDTAKLGKEAYRAVAGSKEPDPAAKPASQTALAHSVVGTDKQPLAELRNQCVDEAMAKLRKAVGAEALLEVLENGVSVNGNAVIVNCRVAVKVPPQASR